MIQKRFLWSHPFVVIVFFFVRVTVSCKPEWAHSISNSIDNHDDAKQIQKLYHDKHQENKKMNASYFKLEMVVSLATSIQLFWNLPDSWVNKLTILSWAPWLSFCCVISLSLVQFSSFISICSFSLCFAIMLEKSICLKSKPLIYNILNA